MPPETSISPLDILAARKRKEASVLSALEGEALNSAYEELDPKMGQREMTSALVTGLLPVLIGGLLKGKKGAAIGAGAGAKGSALYFEGMQEDEKLEREKAKARVQALREMRKSALAGADRAEGSEAYLQSKASKDMGKGTTVNILPEDKPISDVMIKEIKSEGGVSQMAGQTINDILNLMPDAMKKGYQGSDGEVSLSQAVNVWVERLKAKGLGIEAETGRVLNSIDKLVTRYVKTISGAAATDKEREDLKKQIMGDGALVPASIPRILENIQRTRDFYAQGARNTLSLHQGLKQQGAESQTKALEDWLKSAPGPRIEERVKQGIATTPEEDEFLKSLGM